MKQFENEYVHAAYMSKEESSGDIVGISICLAILVMDPVITTPDVNGGLRCHQIAYYQNQSKRQGGLVRSMGP